MMRCSRQVLSRRFWPMSKATPWWESVSEVSQTNVRTMKLTTTYHNTRSKTDARSTIFLNGSPGAGKTTIGKVLGARLGLPVLDMDNDILESVWGMPVSEKLFAVGGDNFVEAEGQVLREFNPPPETVVTLTGSNAMNKEGMEHISRHGTIVFLDVPSEDILQRLEAMKVNRIVGQEADVPMADILEYRQQFYERLYDVRIICEPGESQESIAGKIVSALDRVRHPRDHVSTRSDGRGPGRDFLSTVLQGLADDGGLYVPSAPIPRMTQAQWTRLVPCSYQDRAQRVLEQWIHPSELHPQKLNGMIHRAYAQNNFQSQDVVPVTHLEGNKYLMEVFHGPTASFKDAPLQLMPYFFREAVCLKGDARYLILVATSGDTGSAVLDGFSTRNGGGSTDDVSVMVFYPKDGVSPVQEALMTSVDSPNIKVIGVESDFDFCQSSIKHIFSADTCSLRQRLLGEYNVKLSAANSMNWGRLLPQVVYHTHSYLELARKGVVSVGDEVDLCVPTGNFGNVLGAVYAKKMGIPFRRLICASNKNNVLTEFLETGVYDLRQRKLQVTMSPAIDILKSSNLERLLYLATDCNGQEIRDFYDQLSRDNFFKVSDKVLSTIRDELGFIGDWCDETTCSNAIRDTYNKTGYLLDPHTAVGKVVAERHPSNDSTPMLICSTAHYGKFAPDVLHSLGLDEQRDAGSGMEAAGQMDAQGLLERLGEVGSRPGRHGALERAMGNGRVQETVVEASLDAVSNEILSFVQGRIRRRTQ